ncbi:MAG: hypothetical protein ABI388_03535 [Bacteroidia bacterium]
MIKKFILATILTASASFAFAQDKEKEDESKMIREVINVQADKSLFTVKTPPPAPNKNGKKHVEEVEPAAPDTSNPLIPAPAFELAKRAQNWSNDKPVANSKYTKNNCSANGNMATCQFTFIYKVKDLNPTEKVDGEITMTITVEAKEGKYRYTVNNIRHKATVSDVSGGDVFANVAECGSMKISDLTWKKIKSAAFADAKVITDDLKAKMDKPSGETVKKDDW